eukprot:760670-Hanusia_phi.AAC.3
MEKNGGVQDSIKVSIMDSMQLPVHSKVQVRKTNALVMGPATSDSPEKSLFALSEEEERLNSDPQALKAAIFVVGGGIVEKVLTSSKLGKNKKRVNLKMSTGGMLTWGKDKEGRVMWIQPWKKQYSPNMNKEEYLSLNRKFIVAIEGGQIMAHSSQGGTVRAEMKRVIEFLAPSIEERDMWVMGVRMVLAMPKREAVKRQSCPVSSPSRQQIISRPLHDGIFKKSRSPDPILKKEVADTSKVENSSLHVTATKAPALKPQKRPTSVKSILNIFKPKAILETEAQANSSGESDGEDSPLEFLKLTNAKPNAKVWVGKRNNDMDLFRIFDSDDEDEEEEGEEDEEEVAHVTNSTPGGDELFAPAGPNSGSGSESNSAQTSFYSSNSPVLQARNTEEPTSFQMSSSSGYELEGESLLSSYAPSHEHANGWGAITAEQEAEPQAPPSDPPSEAFPKAESHDLSFYASTVPPHVPHTDASLDKTEDSFPARTTSFPSDSKVSFPIIEYDSRESRPLSAELESLELCEASESKVPAMEEEKLLRATVKPAMGTATEDLLTSTKTSIAVSAAKCSGEATWKSASKEEKKVPAEVPSSWQERSVQESSSRMPASSSSTQSFSEVVKAEKAAEKVQAEPKRLSVKPSGGDGGQCACLTVVIADWVSVGNALAAMMAARRKQMDENEDDGYYF